MKQFFSASLYYLVKTQFYSNNLGTKNQAIYMANSVPQAITSELIPNFAFLWIKARSQKPSKRPVIGSSVQVMCDEAQNLIGKPCHGVTEDMVMIE